MPWWELEGRWAFCALVSSGLRARYSPRVSHPHRVPPHGQVADQRLRGGLLTLVAVQVQCPIRLRWGKHKQIRKKKGRKQGQGKESEQEGAGKTGRGQEGQPSQRPLLASTIWFSGLISCTWGTLMFTVAPACSAWKAGHTHIHTP